MFKVQSTNKDLNWQELTVGAQSWRRGRLGSHVSTCRDSCRYMEVRGEVEAEAEGEADRKGKK